VSTLERAIELAARAHTGQVDKAGEPYILHPLRVMLTLETRTDRIAEVLHDVIEDTGWTLEGLREKGFAPEVVEAVDGLTRRDGESCQEFARRAGLHPVARRVKIADIEDNLDLSRIPKPTEAADRKRIERYERARDVLRD